jgi:intracellular multiplication protein IcmE
MANSIDNFKHLMANNSKARTGIIIIVVVTVLAMAFGYYNIVKSGRKQATSVQLGGVPELANQPGATSNAKYAEAITTNNNAKFNEADNKGGTALPTPVQLDNKGAALGAEVGTSLGAGPRPVDPASQAQATASLPQTANYTVAPLTPQVQYQQAQVVQNQSQQAYVPGQFKNLDQLVGTLVDRWSPTGQNMETDYTGGRNGGASASGQTGSNNGYSSNPNVALNGGSGASNSTMTVAQKVLIRAGTFYPGVTITGVDTDEPGPVLAKILEGPYKGATILGAVSGSGQSQNSEKVALQFNDISSPNLPKSISVQAYAVNPDSSKLGLATNVDHHYMQRFGILLASSFISGYGQALQQSGSTVTTNPLGGSTVSTPVKTPQEISKIALGQVGQSIGQALAPTANRPITIHVAPGTPIGILFVKDVMETAAK